MKISQKLEMRQEENNVSSGYSSRGESSSCDIYYHTITATTATSNTCGAVIFSDTAAELGTSTTLNIPSLATTTTGATGSGGRLSSSSSRDTSPLCSESGGTIISGGAVNSGGSGTILAKQHNVNNVITSSKQQNNTNNINKQHQYISKSLGEHTLDDTSTMLTSNSNNKKHSRCLSPSYSCCQKTEMLVRLNEELIQQRRDLEENNRSLSEEIQISRRFYQGTLADLTAQLSLAENRIKYLKEVVSTQEEALQNNGKGQGIRSNGNVLHQQDNLQHFTQPPSVSGHLKASKSLPTSPRGSYLESARSVTSSTGSTSSELSSSRSRLKNFAKMKEQLLEKNQNLKTDIELLKFRSEVPRSASVPILNTKSNQEFPAIKTHGKRTEWVSNSQFVEDTFDSSSLKQDTPAKYIVPQIIHEVRHEQKKKGKNRLK